MGQYVGFGLEIDMLNARGVQTAAPIATGRWGQVWAKKQETSSESPIQAG